MIGFCLTADEMHYDRNIKINVSHLFVKFAGRRIKPLEYNFKVNNNQK